VIEAGWGYTAPQAEQIRRDAIAADRRQRALQDLVDQAQELNMGHGASAEGLPPLPKTVANTAESEPWRTLPITAAGLKVMLEQFAREAIAHYQRKQAALQEIIDIGQEIEGGAAPNVKTWQERANELAVSGRPRGYPDTDELEALKDAEIADLRARLANTKATLKLSDRCLVSAQLAAKGQGKPVARANYWSTVGSSGWEFKWLGEKPASGMSVDLYLAAPASAQPADPRLEAFIDWYLREGERSEIHPNGHIERTTREHVLAWLDQATGAQPDQRGSAAEGGSKK
jgi:hypothetical protein